MKNDPEKSQQNFCFTPEGKLRKENEYLKQRLTNLEIFKKNFFSTQAELIKAREKLAILEQQLNLELLRDRIVSSSDSQEEILPEVPDSTDNILDFFQHSLSSNSYQDLVELFFSAVEGLGLDVVVQVDAFMGKCDYFIDTIAEEKQQYYIKLIEYYKKLPDTQELIEKQKHICINLGYLCLIADNMPISDAEKNRKLTEYLKILAIGINAYFSALDKNIEIDDLRKNVYKIFKKTHDSFESMQDNLDTQIISISELYLKFETGLNGLLLKTEISDEFMSLIKLLQHDMRSELNLILTSSLTVDEVFMETIKKLEKAYFTKYSGLDV
ncbi:hypothetical protein MNBD_GAMMA09-2067 [hydrothermal vent metagenome]|uniref:Uncharacterized protein n=1 Tax=hydrothermal vent metagenome TaxID=652676 RepID=A0A3B0XWX4_9ZZZZ